MKCKIPNIVLAILCIFGLTVAQNQIPADIQAEIDEAVSEFILANQLASIAIAVTKKNGEILYTRGYGVRDIEANVSADSFTLYGIGSISKSFTASIVVKTLNEKFPDLGESALDIPIRQLVPSYNFTSSDRYRSESTNFRDLLSHRECQMPEGMGLWVEAFTDDKDFLYRHRYAPEICSFRTGYTYNNGLIGMAGDIIAHIANSTYDQLLANLLTEIGMNQTTIVRKTDDHNNMPNRSVPYFMRDGRAQRYNTSLFKAVTVVTPAGGILSSANDMAKYLQFHLNYGKVGSVQVVPEAVMKWLHRPSNLNSYGAFKTEESDVIDLDYASALCLNLGTYDGWSMVSHGGYLPPYESHLAFYPELEIGIFSTDNGPVPSFFSNFSNVELNNRILNAVRGSPRPRRNLTPAKGKKNPDFSMFSGSNLKEKSKTSINKPIVKIEPTEIVGNFGNGMSGDLSITLKTNATGGLQPYLTFGIWGESWLTQVSPSTFSVFWETDFIQYMYLQAPPEENIRLFLNFPDADTLQIMQDDIPVSTEFSRDQTVDSLPAIPWSPDSCGPSQ